MKTNIKLPLLSCLLLNLFFFHAAVAQNTGTLNAIPSALIIGKKEIKSFSVRLDPGAELNTNFAFCMDYHGICYPLRNSKSNIKHSSKALYEGKSHELEYQDFELPSVLINLLSAELGKLEQGQSIQAQLTANSTDGVLTYSTPFYFYPALKKETSVNTRLSFYKEDKKDKKSKSHNKNKKSDIIKTSATDSFNYRSPGGAPSEACTGTQHVKNSYKDFFNCTDAAIAGCTQSDADEKAFCIYERCGNPPDLFDQYWRDIDGGNSDFGGQTYIKNGFGSSASIENKFQIQLHPCLYDGAALVLDKFNSSINVMNKGYPLSFTLFEAFHPARSENLNLSKGRVRIDFNSKLLVSFSTTNFGETTVPYTYYQEYFKSLERTAETQDQIFWVNGVIPVQMYYRPQGIFGLEIQARVSPVSRVLETNFSSYSDFGTAAGSGPARNGVEQVSQMGIVSLMQAEGRSRKYVTLRADADGIRPSIADLTEVEYWPPRGSFKPVCAQWFASNSTNPGKKPYQCATLIDFGELSTRVGSIKTVRNGTERKIEYRDPSDEETEENLDPYFPYRSPILDDF